MNKTLLVLVWLLMSSIALAAIPNQITIQGRLTDANDVPVPSASYIFKFSVYDSPIIGSGNIIWSEQFSVYVTNGLFNTFLTPPPSATFDNPYYLETWVGLTPATLNLLSPRVNITSSGYAFYANVSGGIAGNLNMKGNSIFNVADTNASRVCIAGICQTSWSSVVGVSGWKTEGNYLYNDTTGVQVGIGTKPIANGPRLVVTNDVNVTGSIIVGRRIYGTQTGCGGNGCYLEPINNSYLTNLSAANYVGIRTTTPKTPLDIYGPSDASGTANTGILQINGSLRFDNNEIITNTNGILYVQNDNNGDLQVDSGTLFVDASADSAGIGTTGPAYKLDVAGTGRFTSNLYLNKPLILNGSGWMDNTIFFGTGEGSNTPGFVGPKNPKGPLYENYSSIGFFLQQQGIDSVDYRPDRIEIFINKTGQDDIWDGYSHVFSITTWESWIRQFEVIGNGWVRARKYLDLDDPNSVYWYLDPASTTGTSLTVNGSVGIGTPSPSAKLHLAGNMKIDDINTLEFGADVPGKEGNAGKIGYQTFSGDSLDIVGAGTTSGSRIVRIYDYLYAEGRVRTPIVNAYYIYPGNPIVGGYQTSDYLYWNGDSSGVLAVRNLSANNYVKGGNGLCIGSDCRNTWPSGGGGSGWKTEGNYLYNDTTGVQVGIGTKPVSGGQRLVVTNDVNVTGSIMALRHYGNSLGTCSGTGCFLVPQANSLMETLYINGTTNTQTKLYVASKGSDISVANFSCTGNGYCQNIITNGTITADWGVRNGGVYMGANSNHNLVLRTNANDRLVIDTSGNVGIGTTSPANKLGITVTANDVIPSFGSNGGSFGIFKYDDGPGAGDYGIIMGVLNTGNVFQQVQRIDGGATAYNLLLQPSGGNVGIGTQNPTAKLHVLQTNAPAGPAEGGLYVYNSGTNGNAIIAARTTAAAGKPFLSLDIDGVQGWSAGIDDTDGNKFKIAHDWNFDTSHAAQTIDTSGNVGIGKTDPGAKLDVNGVIRSNTQINVDLTGKSSSSGRDAWGTTISSDNTQAVLFCSRDGTSNCNGFYFYSADAAADASLAAGAITSSGNLNVGGGYYKGGVRGIPSEDLRPTWASAVNSNVVWAGTSWTEIMSQTITTTATNSVLMVYFNGEAIHQGTDLGSAVDYKISVNSIDYSPMISIRPGGMSDSLTMYNFPISNSVVTTVAAGTHTVRVLARATAATNWFTYGSDNRLTTLAFAY